MARKTLSNQLKVDEGISAAVERELGIRMD